MMPGPVFVYLPNALRLVMFQLYLQSSALGLLVSVTDMEISPLPLYHLTLKLIGRIFAHSLRWDYAC